MTKRTYVKRTYSEGGSMIYCRDCEKWLPVDQFPETGSICWDCYYEKMSIQKSNSLSEQLRYAYKAQKEAAGYLTEEDDLTVLDLEEMLDEQNWCCVASEYEHFEKYSDFEIAHIQAASDGGKLTRSNIVLTCHKHNGRGKSGQKSITYMTTN